jgi:hypothetical protein
MIAPVGADFKTQMIARRQVLCVGMILREDAARSAQGTEFPRHGQNHDRSRTTNGLKGLRACHRCL